MNEIKGETPDYKISYSVDPYHGNKLAGEELDVTFSGSPYYVEHNYWQKCPICQGSGKRFMYSDTGENHFVSDYNDCPTCNGKRIISTITGKPPSDDR